MGEGYAAESFVQNRACRFFPCHEGVDPQDFNCLLCYCPLYLLGEECGGNFAYTADGVKDCSSCVRPHRGVDGVSLVGEKWPLISTRTRQSV